MAAINPSKKSTKIFWRTCISCTTRLSELCYDTHTLCEACRGKVCNSTSFCKECENWMDEFRKLYVCHKRSLLLKRVSKKDKRGARAKAKSPLQVDTAPPPQVDDAPHQVDDAASSASQESHVSPPVVILPLNQELMDANIGLEELQQFQHVDNVVELQLQPVSPAPPSTTVSVDTSFFDKVNTMMENFNKFMPFLSQLGSDRRSPTAGPSDIVSPNPIARVPGSEGWDAKNAITPASSQLQVELSRRLPSHSLGSSVPGGSPMVVLGDPTTAGSRSLPTSAGLELLLRCFRRRLGCNNGGTTSVRSMDSKPKANVHQPQRDDGSTERPLRVQPVPQRQDDRPVLRQCHSSRVSQAIGRHEVQGPVPQSKRDPPVGRIYADQDPTPVHPGVSQLESGSPQSSQSGNRLRVDTAPTGSPGSPSPVAGDHRPVCNLADGKTPSVLCPSVGTQGNGGRCVPPTLGQPPGVCLPSDSHHKGSSSQTESLSPLRAHPDRPLLASKRMVSRSSGTSIRHSNRTTQTPRSTVTTAFPSVSRKSPNASSDCVATLKRFARQAGFSETVAGQLALCRKTSTRLNYQARWGKFRKWCKDSHHRSSEPTIPKIAEFLTFLFRTEKAAVSTIKGYRSMLSSVFKFCLPEISTSPILKDLTRSFEISAPRPIHRSPTWDLDKVLEYLSGPRFEPLADASFRNKTRKALFLLAMATAKRVGELQALSFSVSHRGDDLTLHYDPFFLAKTESASNPLPRSVIVQSLEDFVGDLPERVLCPVPQSVTSEELLARLELLHLDCSSLRQILLDLCRRMLCHFSVAN